MILPASFNVGIMTDQIVTAIAGRAQYQIMFLESFKGLFQDISGDIRNIGTDDHHRFISVSKPVLESTAHPQADVAFALGRIFQSGCVVWIHLRFGVNVQRKKRRRWLGRKRI